MKIQAHQLHIFTPTALIHCSEPSVLAAPELVMVSQYASNAVVSTEAPDDTLATIMPSTQASIRQHYSNTTTQQICLAASVGLVMLNSLRPSGLDL